MLGANGFWDNKLYQCQWYDGYTVSTIYYYNPETESYTVSLQDRAPIGDLELTGYYEIGDEVYSGQDYIDYINSDWYKEEIFNWDECIYFLTIEEFNKLEDKSLIDAIMEYTEIVEPTEPESEVIDIYSLDWKQLYCDRISEEKYFNEVDKVYYSITDMNNDGIPELSYDIAHGGESITLFLCSDITYPVKGLTGASLYKDGRVYCQIDSISESTTFFCIYEWNEKTLDYDNIFWGTESVSAGYDEDGIGYDVFEYTIDDKECSREVWYDSLEALDWGDEKAYLLTPIRYENVVSGSEAIEFFTQLIRNY